MALNLYRGALNSLILEKSSFVSEDTSIGFDVLPREVYYLQVLGDESTGLFSFKLSALPDNDDFTKAQQLDGGTFSVTANNTEATLQIGEPSISDRSVGNSLWWEFTPEASGSFYVSTFGSETDTLLGIYQGAGIGDLSLLSSNDDQSVQLFTSALTIDVKQDNTYFIQVDSGYNPGGFISLSGQFLDAPIFLQTPQSQSADLGDQVVFQGLASGPDPLKYQWRKDGEVLVFKNQTSLVVDAVSEADFGVYQLEVSSPGGMILSTEAVLSRAEVPLEILIQPEPLFLNQGETGTLAVLISGGRNVTYSWYRNFNAIPGTNSNEIRVGSSGFEYGFFLLKLVRERRP